MSLRRLLRCGWGLACTLLRVEYWAWLTQLQIDAMAVFAVYPWSFSSHCCSRSPCHGVPAAASTHRHCLFHCVFQEREERRKRDEIRAERRRERERERRLESRDGHGPAKKSKLTRDRLVHASLPGLLLTVSWHVSMLWALCWDCLFVDGLFCSS
jgi:hypothetical protein